MGYVKVDAIGMGHHFGMSLARYGLDVLLVNVGVPSNDRERFRNLKAELYWGLRERVLVGDVSGLADELAYAQLASLRYEHTPSGQVAMESKDSMLKRGVRSPDRAEAIMLAYAPLQPPPEERDYYYRRGREDRSPGLTLAGLLQQPSGRDTEGIGRGRGCCRARRCARRAPPSRRRCGAARRARPAPPARGSAHAAARAPGSRACGASC